MQIIEVEIVPWLPSLILSMFLGLMLAGRIGKDKHFTAEFKYINENDDFGWFFGISILYLCYLNLISWIIKELNDPGIILKSRTWFFNICICLGATYLILPYLMTITRLRIIEIIATIIYFAISPFLQLPEMFGIPGSTLTIFILIALIILFRITTFFLLLSKKSREFMLNSLRQIKFDLKKKICSTKTTLIVFVLYTILTIFALNFY
ncbi:MAG: hypothetical protein ACTSRZ_03205 [Promethearchaeota archaeon]